MKKALIAVAVMGFGILFANAETIVLDFWDQDAGANDAPFTNGIAYASFSGVDTNVTFTFDLSGTGTGVDELQVSVTGRDAATDLADVGLASGNGLAVEGGNNNAWFDVGETLDFVFTAYDASDNDITSRLKTFDFTGFGMRAHGAEDPDPSVTIAGNTFTTDSGVLIQQTTTFSAVDLSSIAYSFQATRGGAGDRALQLSQLQFEIDPPPVRGTVVSIR